jgi:hypothetical protein
VNKLRTTGAKNKKEFTEALRKRHVTYKDIRRINNAKSFSSGNVPYSVKTGRGSIGSKSKTFK